ncbi:MAG: porin [Syntrophobacteraceae bacterium]|nr:porin [Syntrophobacteraceae bacterium]
MKKYLAPFIVMAFMVSLSWSARAVAQDQTLAEKLLIILKQNHQISQGQYDELRQEAQREKTAQKAAVKKQVKEETAQVAKEYKAKNPLNVSASWKHNQIYFESNDGQFTMHVGGYAQFDFGGATINDQLRNALGSKANTIGSYGAEVRRIKPTFEGTMFGDFDYKAQIDFGGGSTTLQDAWITYYGLPCIANVRVGHMKEPFSLEELTSDEWLEFTERSSANAFVTANNYSDRNTGIMLFNTEFDQRMTWAVGGFMQQDNSSGTSFQAYNNVNIAARVTALPWYANQGCELVHVGFGFRNLFRSQNENPNFASSTSATELEYLSRPEWHLTGLNTVNTGPLMANNVSEINPELAFVYGPFSVQGEYFTAFLSDATMYGYTTNAKGKTVWTPQSATSSPDLSGYYVMASYFITGEHRVYDPKYGVFARPVPACNFNPCAGTWGALELAARYDSIDLNDKTISGGTEQNYTGSLNWYLNPNVKWAFEYTHAHMNGVIATSASNVSTSATLSSYNIHNGDADIFDTRFQVDF